MISKIKIFFNLTKTLTGVLNKKERNIFGIYILGSIFNTFLEIFSISIILFLLFLISGQEVSESNISYFFNLIPIDKSIANLSLLMIIIIFFKTLYQIIFTYNQEQFSYNIQTRISAALFKKYINTSYERIINQNSSDLIRLMSIETVRIGNLLISPFITLVNELFLLVFIMLFIFLYDPILGGFFIFISFFILYFYSINVNSKMKELGKHITESNSKRIKIITETFSAFDFIKLSNKKEVFLKKFIELTKEISNSAFKHLFIVKLPKSIFEIIIFLSLFLVITFFDKTNRIDLLLSYLSIAAVSIYKIIPSLIKITASMQSLQYFSSPLIEIVNQLKLPEETDNYDGIKKSFYKLSYNNIEFNYGENIDLFKNLNFQIDKKDFIGIYGPSGSGKSTFVKLISGLLSFHKGNIILNDKEEIDSKSLRHFFSYVPQDTLLLDEDIFTNVSLEFDKSKIDKDRIMEILNQLEFNKIFLKSLNRKLGERGIKISGGQRQRISIARAIYNNKKILILDESTSNLDKKAENSIIDLLEKLNDKLAIIIVSHKDSSLKKCKKVYEINNNKISKVK